MKNWMLVLGAATMMACAGGNAPAEPKAEEKAEAKVEEKAEEKVEEKAEEKPEAVVVEVGADDGGEYPEVVLESVGDQMAYNVNEITLKADTPTRLKMKSNATSGAMVHNIVVVKKGMEDAVGTAAVTVPQSEHHVPKHEGVLAATKLAGPGETTTVVVNLPAGEYAYICTFPGHYMMMKGVIKVEG